MRSSNIGPKLRPYFQSHTIVILTTFPLRTILPESVRPTSQMGSRVEQVRYRVPAENECKITSARRLLGRTTNGDRNQRGTKFHLAPSRRRILIQARIGHRNPPHISDRRDPGTIVQAGISRLQQRGRVRRTHRRAAFSSRLEDMQYPRLLRLPASSKSI